MAAERLALVVEDEADRWRPKLETVFTLGQWELVFAATVEAAIHQFRNRVDWDLLIVDFDLEVGNGREFLRAAREIDVNIPILLMSGHEEGGFSANDVRHYQTSPHFVSKDLFINNPKLEGNSILAAFEDEMAKRCTPKVESENGQLRTVFVHTPGTEVDLADPDHLPWYLVEQIPDPDQAKVQHTEFTRLIKEHAKRPIVLDVQQLLLDVVRQSDRSTRHSIIEDVLFSDDYRRMHACCAKRGIALSDRISEFISALSEKSPEEITVKLIHGVSTFDLAHGGGRESDPTRMDSQLFPPTVNQYFTRDPGFVLGERLIIGRMFWPIRRREPRILREIVQRHPFLRNARHKAVDLVSDTDLTFSVEGGDVMAIDTGVYAIAESERTNRLAIRRIVHALFTDEGTTKVLQPIIPARRAFIHLDTVCSIAGRDGVAAFSEAVDAQAITLEWTRDIIDDNRREPAIRSERITDILQNDYGRTIIPVSRLEQFDDGANVFMIDKNVAICYSRNQQANAALAKHGVDVKTFMGSDLVCGRGGPRCMTMPIQRD